MFLSLLLFPLLALMTGGLSQAKDARPRAEVRLAMQLTRADDGGGAAAAPQVVGTPLLNTLDGSTGSLSVTGGELSYSVSCSPTVEAGGSVALLWNLQLSGKGLPGANSVTLNGASRVAAGKDEPLTEVTLKDPKTGRVSTFRLRVTTTVTDSAAPAP